jgi:hypothetical protein
MDNSTQREVAVIIGRRTNHNPDLIKKLAEKKQVDLNLLYKTNKSDVIALNFAVNQQVIGDWFKTGLPKINPQWK